MLPQAANLVQHGQSCVADYLLKVRKLSASRIIHITSVQHVSSVACLACPTDLHLPMLPCVVLLPCLLAWCLPRAAPSAAARCAAACLETT